MGCREEIKREWPRHRRFVRKHACCACGTSSRIVFAHLRIGHTAGKDQKPFDWLGISLCWDCHEVQHRVGHKSFDAANGIDSLKLAAEFVQASPDAAMREYMRSLQPGNV